MFSFNHIDHKQDALDKKLLEDRHKYDTIYRTIEEYISKNSDIVLGGSLSVKGLLGKARDLNDFEYTCYSENALNHSNELTNKIAQVVDSEFVKIHKTMNVLNNPIWVVSLKTIIPFQLYGIIVDSRLLVKFRHLAKGAMAVMNPSDFKISQDIRIKIMPPRYHLIESYRDLVDPNKASEWQQLLQDERRLFKYLRKNFNPSELVPKTGGKQQNDIRKKAILQILKYMTNNAEIALIGEFALRFLNIKADSNIITCISQNPRNVVKDITEMFSDHISHNTREVKVFSDFRLTRTSVKIGISPNMKEIVYIYNAAEYDLIPVNRIMNDQKTFIQIGNPFVILRFLLIDIWIIRSALNANKIDEKFADMRLQKLLDHAIQLRIKMSKTKLTISDDLINHSNSLQIFQSRSDEYIGVRILDVIAQKTKSIASNKFFGEYFPQEFHRIHNKYRTMSLSSSK